MKKYFQSVFLLSFSTLAFFALFLSPVHGRYKKARGDAENVSFGATSSTQSQDIGDLSLRSEAERPGYKKGVVKVFRVRGSVYSIEKSTSYTKTLSRDKTSQSSKRFLRRGDVVTPGSTIITEKNSSVMLIFSNATTINIDESTTFRVEGFIQKSTQQKTGNFSELEREPSASHLQLSLTRGKVTGQVKKLNEESSFELETPLGSAVVKGTRFSLMVDPGLRKGGAKFAVLVVDEGVMQFRTIRSATANVEARLYEESDDRFFVDVFAGNSLLISGIPDQSGALSLDVTESVISPQQARDISDTTDAINEELDNVDSDDLGDESTEEELASPDDASDDAGDDSDSQADDALVDSDPTLPEDPVTPITP